VTDASGGSTCLPARALLPIRKRGYVSQQQVNITEGGTATQDVAL
jgi:hypothetical protein